MQNYSNELDLFRVHFGVVFVNLTANEIVIKNAKHVF